MLWQAGCGDLWLLLGYESPCSGNEWMRCWAFALVAGSRPFPESDAAADRPSMEIPELPLVTESVTNRTKP